jgi:[acyl-carrier-protein] S-malonyltransferase
MNISFEGPKESLTPTNIAQPAIFMADLAAALALKERGVTAGGAAGFSLGEVPALAYCGLLGLKEAYDFVCFRAAAMQRCTEEHKGGMMAVLGLSEQALEEICSKIDGAYPVNYNAPGQITAAFRAESEDDLKAAVAAARGKAIALQVAGAFHSPLMDGAAASIGDYLKNVSFGEISVPLYANVTGRQYGSPNEAGKLLARQVNHPVRWQLTIENMIADGYDTFIETGPGKALIGMIKKIDRNVRTFNVFDEESLSACVTVLNAGVPH